MHAGIQKLEQFLRIDRMTSIADTMRARAVYMIALTFVVSQIVNIILMSHTYGHWTFDHWVCVGVSIGVLLITLVLRYTDKFYIFACFYSMLLIAGIALSAIFDHTGINSALLPILMGGVVINGFVSGWRMVGLYWVVGIVFTWFLYNVSISAPTGALFDPLLFQSRNFQRAVQAVIGFSLISLIVGYASYRMNHAFAMLEEKIVEIEKSQGERSKFFANMSHELRTPLNGIMGFAELLEKSSLNPQQEKYASIVSKSSASLLSIINDALDIARIDTGKFVLKPSPFDLHDLLESVLNLYQPLAIKKGLLMGVQIPDEMPKKYIGDENRLRQILNNLLNNAVKFTDQGSVYIKVEQQHDISANNIKISIVDTGVGISEKDKETVFERFAQIDNSLTRENEGTGLGLSICREIASNMGGSLGLSSQLGQGSVF